MFSVASPTFLFSLLQNRTKLIWEIFRALPVFVLHISEAVDAHTKKNAHIKKV